MGTFKAAPAAKGDPTRPATVGRSPSPPPVSWLHQVRVLWRKEMYLEAAERTRVRALVPFALLVVLMFSLAVGPTPKLLSQLCGSFLWLAILFTSVLCLGESMRAERDHGALEGLRLAGVHPSALFVAKAAANALFVSAVGAFVLPVAIAVFDAPLRMPVSFVVAAVALGSMALSAPGTLFAALASETRAREVLLPLLSFPLLVPPLIAAVRLTAVALAGDPMDERWAWLTVLALFNGLYWPLCALLFERVVEA